MEIINENSPQPPTKKSSIARSSVPVVVGVIGRWSVVEGAKFKSTRSDRLVNRACPSHFDLTCHHANKRWEVGTMVSASDAKGILSEAAHFSEYVF